MWTCPYCGGTLGQPFQDDQLRGMLCLQPDCGRFVETKMDLDDGKEWNTSDL
ncbi:hypothetical protein [Brevibacillus sp. H7]|uniref:hypothetical protein n=1 Tax=Brevibacillus sp. H7 TaxID=3349138 RepID=UPI0037FED1C3